MRPRWECGTWGDRDAYRELTENVLSGGALSATTTQILNRRGPTEQFKNQPAEVIALLHKGMPATNDSDRLFALAELSFLHTTQSSDRSHFLGVMLYGYGFLFPKDPSQTTLDPFDPRTRTAGDISNQGPARGFAVADGKTVNPAAGRYSLPFGELTVSIDDNEFPWGNSRFVDSDNATFHRQRSYLHRHS